MAETKWNATDVQRLYRHHGAVLIAYARSFLPDAAAAEDVVHAVFLRLLRGDVTAPESELGYLYRAVKNAALNAKRDVSRETELASGERWFVHRNGNTE
ncbi:MAG TPA: sigma factor, partial [Candidatus Eremiobacteraceae bacterium]|nr:sigma factor [Candidatus Eremiobacteraceae bacterium]